MVSQPLTAQHSLSLLDRDDVAVVFFFQPTDTFGKVVQWLQSLLGFTKDSPSHVGIYYKKKLFELTADGTSARECSALTLQMLCSSSHFVYLGDDQIMQLNALVDEALEYEWRFDLVATIWYCFRIVVLNRGRKLVFNAADYNTVFKVDSTKATSFTPPLSCTTFVWNTLDLPFDWRIFCPAALKQALEESFE